MSNADALHRVLAKLAPPQEGRTVMRARSASPGAGRARSRGKLGAGNALSILEKKITKASISGYDSALAGTSLPLSLAAPSLKTSKSLHALDTPEDGAGGVYESAIAAPGDRASMQVSSSRPPSRTAALQALKSKRQLGNSMTGSSTPPGAIADPGSSSVQNSLATHQVQPGIHSSQPQGNDAAKGAASSTTQMTLPKMTQSQATRGYSRPVPEPAAEEGVIDSAAASEQASLSHRLKLAEEANTALQAALTAALEEGRGLKNQVTNLTSLTTHLKGQLGNDKASSLEALNARLVEAEERAADAERRAAHATAANEELAAQLMDSSWVASRDSGDLSKLQSVHLALLQEHSVLKASNAQVAAAAAANQQQLEALLAQASAREDAALTLLEARTQEEEASRAALLQEIATLTSERDAAIAQLARAQRETSLLYNKKLAKDKAYTALKTKTDAMQSQLQELEKAKEAASSKGALGARLNTLRARNAALEKALAHEKAEREKAQQGMANLEEEVALLVGLVQGGPEGLADLLREGASFYAPLLPSTAGHTTATKGADTNSAHSPAAVAGSAGKDAQEPFSPPHKSVTTKSGDSLNPLTPLSMPLRLAAAAQQQKSSSQQSNSNSQGSAGQRHLTLSPCTSDATKPAPASPLSTTASAPPPAASKTTSQATGRAADSGAKMPRSLSPGPDRSALQEATSAPDKHAQSRPKSTTAAASAARTRPISAGRATAEGVAGAAAVKRPLSTPRTRAVSPRLLKPAAAAAQKQEQQLQGAPRQGKAKQEPKSQRPVTPERVMVQQMVVLGHQPPTVPYSTHTLAAAAAAAAAVGGIQPSATVQQQLMLPGMEVEGLPPALMPGASSPLIRAKGPRSVGRTVQARLAGGEADRAAARKLPVDRDAGDAVGVNLRRRQAPHMDGVDVVGVVLGPARPATGTHPPQGRYPSPWTEAPVSSQFSIVPITQPQAQPQSQGANDVSLTTLPHYALQEGAAGPHGPLAPQLPQLAPGTLAARTAAALLSPKAAAAASGAAAVSIMQEEEAPIVPAGGYPGACVAAVAEPSNSGGSGHHSVGHPEAGGVQHMRHAAGAAVQQRSNEDVGEAGQQVQVPHPSSSLSEGCGESEWDGGDDGSEEGREDEGEGVPDQEWSAQEAADETGEESGDDESPSFARNLGLHGSPTGSESQPSSPGTASRVSQQDGHSHHAALPIVHLAPVAAAAEPAANSSTQLSPAAALPEAEHSSSSRSRRGHGRQSSSQQDSGLQWHLQPPAHHAHEDPAVVDMGPGLSEEGSGESGGSGDDSRHGAGVGGCSGSASLSGAHNTHSFSRHSAAPASTISTSNNARVSSRSGSPSRNRPPLLCEPGPNDVTLSPLASHPQWPHAMVDDSMRMASPLKLNFLGASFAAAGVAGGEGEGWGRAPVSGVDDGDEEAAGPSRSGSPSAASGSQATRPASDYHHYQVSPTQLVEILVQSQQHSQAELQLQGAEEVGVEAADASVPFLPDGLPDAILTQQPPQLAESPASVGIAPQPVPMPPLQAALIQAPAPVQPAAAIAVPQAQAASSSSNSTSNQPCHSRAYSQPTSTPSQRHTSPRSQSPRPTPPPSAATSHHAPSQPCASTQAVAGSGGASEPGLRLLSAERVPYADTIAQPQLGQQAGATPLLQPAPPQHPPQGQAGSGRGGQLHVQVGGVKANQRGQLQGETSPRTAVKTRMNAAQSTLASLNNILALYRRSSVDPAATMLSSASIAAEADQGQASGSSGHPPPHTHALPAASYTAQPGRPSAPLLPEFHAPTISRSHVAPSPMHSSVGSTSSPTARPSQLSQAAVTGLAATLHLPPPGSLNIQAPSERQRAASDLSALRLLRTPATPQLPPALQPYQPPLPAPQPAAVTAPAWSGGLSSQQSAQGGAGVGAAAGGAGEGAAGAAGAGASVLGASVLSAAVTRARPSMPSSPAAPVVKPLSLADVLRRPTQ